MMKNNKKICVVGASGLVGSSIVRYALERGYFVNGTLTDKSDVTKVKYLKKLKNSKNLELFSAKMENEKDLINPMENANAVFIACLIPTYKGKDGTPAKEMDDERGYKEIINPTVNGCLNILKAAKNIVPKAPTAPASVGVAKPKKILPITKKISSKGGSIACMTCFANVFIPIDLSSLGIAGAMSGRIIAIMTTCKANTLAIIIPGTIEPINKVPTGILNWSANTTNTMLGGINWPNVPDATITPAASCLLYP